MRISVLKRERGLWLQYLQKRCLLKYRVQLQQKGAEGECFVQICQHFCRLLSEIAEIAEGNFRQRQQK